MKKVQNALLATIILLAMATNASATKYRVNINSNVTADNKIVFNTVDAAIAYASAGDTIYLEPSANPYSSFTITKKLTILGPGYSLNPSFLGNSGLQANLDEVQMWQNTSITISTGADGSVVSGIEIYQINLSPNLSNISISNNNINFIIRFASGTYNNIFITDNYMLGVSIITQNNCICNNLIFSNNILTGSGEGMSGLLLNYLDPISTATYNISCNGLFITNNTFIFGAVVDFRYNSSSNIIFTNNIMDEQSAIIQNNSYSSFTNNVFGLSQSELGLSGYSNNLYGQTTIPFIGSSGSDDGQWQLTSSLGTGYAPNQIGAFGGSTPYTLSGLPAIPSVTQFTIPSGTITTNTLPITISAKSNQ